MDTMECPICGEIVDCNDTELLENGNPACPSCVREESSKQ
jgi:formylmethanofuran dehydrogenase subunit E